MDNITNLLQAAIAPQTKRTYSRAFHLLNHFVRDTFHVENNLPTSIDVLMFFIAHMHHKHMAASTICTYTTGIGYVNQLAGHYNPAQSFLIKKLLAAVKRGSRSPDTRLPITPSILAKLVESLSFTTPCHYNRIMFKAMYLLACHAFLRVGEMTYNNSESNVLQLRDVQFFQTRLIHPSRLQLTFRSFKANYNIRPIVLSLEARESYSDVCPVRSLYQFIELRGPQPGPLFCFPGIQYVSYSFFRETLSNSLSRSGLSPSRYKSHSFRVGAASTAATLGISDEQIQHMGRWKSLAFKSYIRLPTMYNAT